jgi:5-methylcytosine-specific restriction endonuclease McrA
MRNSRNLFRLEVFSLKKGVIKMSFSESIKKIVQGRQNGYCALCGYDFKKNKEDRLWDFHHVKPHHLGGNDTSENCVMVCTEEHEEVLHPDGDFKSSIEFPKESFPYAKW